MDQKIIIAIVALIICCCSFCCMCISSILGGGINYFQNKKSTNKKKAGSSSGGSGSSSGGSGSSSGGSGSGGGSDNIKLNCPISGTFVNNTGLIKVFQKPNKINDTYIYGIYEPPHLKMVGVTVTGTNPESRYITDGITMIEDLDDDEWDNATKGGGYKVESINKGICDLEKINPFYGVFVNNTNAIRISQKPKKINEYYIYGEYESPHLKMCSVNKYGTIHESRYITDGITEMDDLDVDKWDNATKGSGYTVINIQLGTIDDLEKKIIPIYGTIVNNDFSKEKEQKPTKLGDLYIFGMEDGPYFKMVGIDKNGKGEARYTQSITEITNLTEAIWNEALPSRNYIVIDIKFE